MVERNDLTREEELQEIEEDMKQPWDRLPSEPEEQYDLFQRFLLQGPKRKVTKVTRMAGVTQHLGTLYRFSRRWRWKERAAYWDRDRARRMDDAMFWHEYETRVRNLEKLEAAVDKLVGNIEAAHIEDISQEKALIRMGPNANLLFKAMKMEERLLNLARRDHCPFCRMR